MQQAFAWFATQTFNPPLDVAPWTSVPSALKTAALGWSDMFFGMEETRIETNTPPFATADDPGTFIELGIHGWIHGPTATHFNEPVVGTFHSPQSTYFYKIHGLVDYWWTQWRQKHGPKFVKDVIDSGIIREPKLIKDVVDTKDLSYEIVHVKGIKEIFEGGQPGLGGDPAWQIAALAQRVENLELQVAIGEAAHGRAFIRPQERPEVGAEVLKDERLEEHKRRDQHTQRSSEA